MIYVAAIASFIIPIIVKLILNFNKWKKEQSVNHSKEWKVVSLCEIPAGLLFLYPVLPVFESDYFEYVIQLFYRILVISLMMMFWFWNLFDGIYNVIRKFNWWFTGSNDPDDAMTDNFLQSLKKWQQITFKTGTVILFTTLYLLIVF